MELRATVPPGSPPRVRSRRDGVAVVLAARGITSACAEQTTAPSTRPSWTRDHLRVCGADLVFACPMASDWGSPPRVRSRLTGTMILFPSGRITSACAEQTKWTCSRPCVTRDHLRVCGADVVGCVSEACGRGSPPRVRSRPGRHRHQLLHHGITSACAEQTTAFSAQSGQRWDHLRVCGADFICASIFAISPGSPPRVRSRQPDALRRSGSRGITSACAEQTHGPP